MPNALVGASSIRNMGLWVWLVVLFLIAWGYPSWGDGWGLVGLFSLLGMMLTHWLWKRSPQRLPPGILPLCLWVLLLFSHLLPLPPVLLKSLSPFSWQIYRSTVWLIDPGSWLTVAIFPKATLVACLQLIAVALLYVLAAWLPKECTQIQRMVMISLCLLGFLSLAIFSFVKFSSGGLDEGTIPLAVVLAPLGLTLALMYFHDGNRDLVPNLLRLVGESSPHFSWVPILLFVTALLAGISLRQGQNASLTFSLALLLGGGLLLLRRNGRRSGLVMVTTAALLLGLHSWMDSPTLMQQRGGQGFTVSDVPEIGLLGHGFVLDGSTVLQQGTEDVPKIWRTLVAKTGVLGCLLACWFWWEVLAHTWTLWMRRPTIFTIYFFPAVAGVLVSFLLSDWSLTDSAAFPATCFLALMTGFVVASVRGQGFDHARSRKDSWHLSVATVISLAWFAALAIGIGMLVSTTLAKGIKQGDFAMGTRRIISMAKLAAVTDPLEPQRLLEIARFKTQSGETAPALTTLRKAWRLEPLSVEIPKQLGLLYNQLGQRDQAAVFFGTAMNNSGLEPELSSFYLDWLLEQGRREEAIRQTRRTLAAFPERSVGMISLLFDHQLHLTEMIQSLPPLSMCHQALAEYLYAEGDREHAGDVYRRALHLAAREDNPPVALFENVASFYLAGNDWDSAVDALQRGLEQYPENLPLRMEAADLYERRGLSLKAIEIYRTGLLLEPGNQELRKNLLRLTGSS